MPWSLGRILPFQNVVNKIATSCYRGRILNLCHRKKKKNHSPRNLKMTLAAIQTLKSSSKYFLFQCKPLCVYTFY